MKKLLLLFEGSRGGREVEGSDLVMQGPKKRQRRFVS